MWMNSYGNWEDGKIHVAKEWRQNIRGRDCFTDDEMRPSRMHHHHKLEDEGVTGDTEKSEKPKARTKRCMALTHPFQRQFTEYTRLYM